MRLFIDLQGAQSASSRNRGIGRYSQALAEAMVRRARDHDVFIGLSDAFPDTIEPIRGAFDSLLPQERIICWRALNGVAECDPSNLDRRHVGEILYESFLASLKPDIIHISSLFEGFGDDVITASGTFIDEKTTAVTFYDLIPLIYGKQYLTDRRVEAWYNSKLDSLRNAGLLLAISESSRQDGIDLLKIEPERIVNISTAADQRFHPIDLSETRVAALRSQYGLDRPFVMYTGGIDHRKNIEGLIAAFAALPADIRFKHQLAIVCSAGPASIRSLQEHARRCGLNENDLVMTGFVSDDDLVALYNMCRVFCFPSLYEGFGLPALEAMQCGAPTIGSNLSSIPEVIGRRDALFDPRDKEDMTAHLHKALTDPDYRQNLAEHGLQQAKKFSWDESADRAWDAFEQQHERVINKKKSVSSVHRKALPSLAYVSPLPPERSGIADYSEEILPGLAKFYNISVIVNQRTVSDALVKEDFVIRDVDWFEKHGHEFDRILYHFGNSTFHSHMFDLLERYAGVVVLHDFHLSGIVSHMETYQNRPAFWGSYLYRSHGYPALKERYSSEDWSNTIYKWPVNAPPLRNAVGVIFHSNFSISLASRFYRSNFPENRAVVPLARRAPEIIDRTDARAALGFASDDFVICSFGGMGPTKQNVRLLQAWLNSSLAASDRCYLVFVGEEDHGEYGREIRRIIGTAAKGHRVKITGFASPSLYKQYLQAADLAVQLRTLSRGETSAAVLDCMGYALPTIVNANGSMAELPGDCVMLIEDEYSDQQLIESLEEMFSNNDMRKIFGEGARSYIIEYRNTYNISKQYMSHIEDFYLGSSRIIEEKAINSLAKIDGVFNDKHFGYSVARAIAYNLPKSNPQFQLLVDISELVQRDAGSGIQRVVRSVLKEMIDNPPKGYRVEPVYADLERRGYRYARNFTLNLMNCPTGFLEDAPVQFHQGDIFLGLDFNHHIVIHQSDYFSEMRRFGVKIYFIVYDLLPINLEKHFPPFANAAFLHRRWLSILGNCADGLVCISAAVAGELTQWLQENLASRHRPIRIESFHLGSDIQNSHPSRGLPEDAGRVLEKLATEISFLMVGTIEPRKGYGQALAAFEILWASGRQINLVIVGRKGWISDDLIERLKDHPEAGKRLFWLQGISDEYLEKIYAASDCLIAASEGEGFGLPLIEAAQHKLPIIARDIPVFREVAGDHAFYFAGLEGDALARAVGNWMDLKREDKHPRSEEMPWLTWKQSTQQLLSIVLQ